MAISNTQAKKKGETQAFKFKKGTTAQDRTRQTKEAMSERI